MAIIRLMLRVFTFFLIMIVLPSIGIAATPTWEIVPSESSLNFTGTMNNAHTSGQFKIFKGEIKFDPNNLNDSKVRIVVDTGSVMTPYTEIADTLKTSDWFDVKLFPQAIFQTNKITKTSDKTYQADGSLTIRAKSNPIVITFTEEENSQNKVKVKGTTTLKRTQFGVGQGEWKSTSDVGDEVIVNFNITAIKKSS